MMRRMLIVGLATLGLGCPDDGGRNPFSSDSSPSTVSAGSITAGTSNSGGATSTATEGTSASDSADGTAGPKLDVGFGSDGTAGDDGVTAEGCEKVDFLFVIDNSGSMGDNQDSLIASFPGFIQSIQTTLTDAQDYHVMVVDTDATWGGMCEFLCGGFGFCPDIPAYPCGMPVEECNATLGSGVVHTMASDAPNVNCNFSSGGRYMDTTEPNLTTAFQCAAKVGSDGDNSERPMGAMVGALSADLAMPGNCNEGFVREDAILVVTIITDEEDDDSNGIPEGWYANVISSKFGDANAIVMLGLINDIDAPAPVCPLEVQDPAKIRQFVDMFPNSIRGSVCAASYTEFFQQAVDLISTTCDEFIPPAG